MQVATEAIPGFEVVMEMLRAFCHDQQTCRMPEADDIRRQDLPRRTQETSLVMPGSSATPVSGEARRGRRGNE